MLHELSSGLSSVPEELYNLTQLADVTLAAGKLSTTNTQTIKNYIKLVDPTAVEKSTETNLTDLSVMRPKLLPLVISDKIQQHEHQLKPTLNDSGYVSDLEATHQFKYSFDAHSNKMLPTEKHSALLKTYSDQRQSSFSSSEDDSTYNYSHKIFDKRKTRKLYYQSDDSEYLGQKKRKQFDMYGRNNTMEMTDDSILSVSESESNTDCSSSNKSIECNTVADDVHVCPECGKKYSTSSNLARHRQTHRSLLDKKARRCPHCDKVYVSMPAYSMHVRTHNQGCECPHCGKRFSRPWLLQGHIRTHTGEKPFQCSICTKAFADKSNLRAHIQTHSNTKPHTCMRCGKAFALKSYLYKHEESSCMRNHNKNDKEKEKSSNKKNDNNNAKSLTPKKNTSELARKLKEKTEDLSKFVSGINNSSPVLTPPLLIPENQESIILDVGSRKSYMDLTSTKLENEPYPRISVIRTVCSQSPVCSNNPFDFSQEKPVDFSPKNKYKVDECSANNLLEISRQYATMVV